jgi:molecular chaperone DnaK
MRVGIDFGTTHTVAAVVDRGNYPVASFDGVDTWPSLIRVACGAARCGAAMTARMSKNATSSRPVERWR